MNLRQLQNEAASISIFRKSLVKEIKITIFTSVTFVLLEVNVQLQPSY